MPSKKSMNDIAPPPRKKVQAVPATSATAATTLVALNVRIPEEHASYVRMLSAKTRQSQQTLIEKAIDLLREKEGEI